jgi:hypothetical protein
MWNGVTDITGTKHSPSVFKFGGKTDRAQLMGGVVEAMDEYFNTPEVHTWMLEQFHGVPVCFYGEGYGGKIQKMSETYGKDQNFILFDIKVGDQWLAREKVEDIAEKLKIPIVPVVCSGNLDLMKAQVKYGFKSSLGDGLAEGLIGTPAVPLKDTRGRRIITKLKTKDFR